MEVNDFCSFTDFLEVQKQWEIYTKKMSNKCITHTYEWAFAKCKSYVGFKNVNILSVRDKEEILLLIPYVAIQSQILVVMKLTSNF